MDATPGFPESRPPQTHALVGPALVGAYFLSGAAALVYQVLWTHRLGNVFGVTVQAASTVLACFMAGLAIGSWWVGRRADRDRNPLRVFALVECLIGVAALLTPFALTGVEGIFVRLSSVDSPALAQIGRAHV